jgi:hypothetical protein
MYRPYGKSQGLAREKSFKEAFFLWPALADTDKYFDVRGIIAARQRPCGFSG